MSMILKINFMERNVTKTMKFNDDVTGAEVMKQIKENHDFGGEDYGLFRPVSETSGPLDGKWLRPNQTLSFYDLSTGDYIECRNKHCPLAITFLDGTKKKLKLDLSQTPDFNMQIVGEKLSMRHVEEFAFKITKEGKPNWLRPEKSLLEQLPNLDIELLVVKKFTATEVSQDDPFTLHLVFVQAKGDILSGLHPTSKEEAVTLAALQQQSERGDYSPSSKLLLNNILPHAHRKTRGVDKLVLAEWKALTGTHQDQAKFRYINKCRTLKTWGITLFHVKQQDPTAKLRSTQNKIFGFTRDKILTISPDGKNVEKTRPLQHLKRWAATSETLTLDFGSHEQEYTVLITTEGEEMSSLIAGYIDILLGKNLVSNENFDETNTPHGMIENLDHTAQMSKLMTGISQLLPRGGTLSSMVTDMDSAVNAINKLVQNMLGDPDENVDLQMTPEERQRQIEQTAQKLQEFTQKLLENTNPVNREALNDLAQKISYGIESLINGARSAKGTDLDPDGNLFSATRGLAEALGSMIAGANNVAANPHDEHAKSVLAHQAKLVSAALERLNMANQGILTDPNYERLMNDLGTGVALAAAGLLNVAERANVTQHPEKRGLVNAAKTRFVDAKDHFGNMSTTLAPVAQQARAQHHLRGATETIQGQAQFLSDALRKYGIDPGDDQNLTDAMRQLGQALNTFLSCTQLPTHSGARGATEFTNAAQVMIEGANAVQGATGKPELIREHASKIEGANLILQNAINLLAGRSTDSNTAQVLRNHGANVARAVQGLISVAPSAASRPDDLDLQHRLREAALKVSETTQDLVADAGHAVSLDSLYTAAKGAIGATSVLVASSAAARPFVNDPRALNNLNTNAQNSQDAVDNFLQMLKTTNTQNDPTGARIMEASERFAPIAYKLVAAAKGAVPKTVDEGCKKDLTYNSDYVAKAIDKLLMCRKATRANAGGAEIKEALEQMGGVQQSIQKLLSTLASAGTLNKPAVGRDMALENLKDAIKEVANSNREISHTIRDKPEEMGVQLKSMVRKMDELTTASAQLCGTIPEDKPLQKEILDATNDIGKEIATMMSTARAAANNPRDFNLTNTLNENCQAVANALGKLSALSKRVEPEKLTEARSKVSKDIEDLAEKEMLGAAQAINSAVLKLKAFKEEAARRAQGSDIDIGGADMSVELLEGCQNLASATSVLMVAATNVQREYNQDRRNVKKTNLYKADPRWAEGLISAAKEVAAMVGHLVQTSDTAVKGTGEIEAVIVSAKGVASSTARLVTASTVKNVNPESVSRVQEASKHVNVATKSLVDVASRFSETQNEQSISSSGPKSKIQQMEDEMEIKKIEQMIQQKRRELLQNRKNEYSNPTPAPAPVVPQQPSAKPTTSPLKPQAQNTLKPALKAQGLKPALKQGLKPQGLKPQGLKPAAQRN